MTALSLISAPGSAFDHATPAAFSSLQARSAATFLDTIGVNVHPSYVGTPYGTSPDVITQRLLDLGIRHIRDNLALPARPPEIAALHLMAAAGIDFDFIAPAPTGNVVSDQAKIDSWLSIIVAEFPDDTAEIEGPNEYDKVGQAGWAAILKTYQLQLYSSVRALASPQLQAVPVLAPSLGGTNTSSQIAGITGFDVGNVHPYPGGEMPESATVTNRVTTYRTNVSGPTRPVELTEDGYHNALNGPAASHRPITEAGAGIYVPRMLLNNFQLGDAKTYLYELADEGTRVSANVRVEDTAHSDIEANFGLLHFDLSYKPAAQAIDDLTKLLADPTPEFTPGTLDVDISSAATDLQKVLLQKSDGSFYLALWRAASVWDTASRAALEVPAVPVTLGFNAPSDLTLYQPGAGNAPIDRTVNAAYSLNVGAAVQLIRVMPPTAPATPTNSAAASGDQAADVTWSQPTDGASPPTSYTVAASPGNAEIQVPASFGRTSYAAHFPSLTSGTSYTFTVTANNPAGASPLSDPSDPVVVGPPPGTPTAVVAVPGDGSASVSWLAPTTGALPLGYTVVSAPGDVSIDVAAEANGAATSVVVPGLDNGTPYTFTVTATSTIGLSPPSRPSAAVTPGHPGAPTGVTASPADGAANVSWTAPLGANATSYTVTADPGGASATVTGTADAPTQAVVSGLTNGTGYTFTVTASNTVGAGEASGSSDPIIPGKPNQPKQVVAVPGDAMATISWTPSGPPASSYRILSSPARVDSTVTSVAGAPPQTQQTVTRLANGTAYTFTVTATNAVGSSAPSAASAAAIPNVPPTTPTNVLATAGNALAKVSWTAPAGSIVTSYLVTASPGGLTTVTQGANVGAAAPTTATVTGLSNGTAYSFTVAATNSVATSAASTPSSVVTPAAPVTLTTIQDTSTAVGYAGWNYVANAAASGGGYRLSSVTGNHASFAFSGTAFSWLTQTGPDRGKAAVLVDGKSLATVDLYAKSAAAATKSFTGLRSAAHTVTIQVLGNNTAATSAGVALDAFKVGAALSQESAAAVSLNDWRNVSNAAASGGTLRINRVANSSISVAFTGTGVDWIGSEGPNYGLARVSVDGSAPSTVDLYATALRWKQTITRIQSLSPGRHTLTILVLGTRRPAATAADVSVDAFIARS